LRCWQISGCPPRDLMPENMRQASYTRHAWASMPSQLLLNPTPEIAIGAGVPGADGFGVGFQHRGG
jgi:hypothetical protein